MRRFIQSLNQDFIEWQLATNRPMMFVNAAYFLRTARYYACVETAEEQPQVEQAPQEEGMSEHAACRTTYLQINDDDDNNTALVFLRARDTAHCAMHTTPWQPGPDHVQ